MNDHAIRGPVLELHDLIVSSIALRQVVRAAPDFYSAIMHAAARAAECGKSKTLVEIVSRVASTNDRVVEAERSGDDVELSEWIERTEPANAALGDILRDLVPERLPIGGNVSSVPVN